MADVIGPNSHLPGQTVPGKEGVMCDEHPDRPAVKRVVGESDSFGSELHDLCQECYDKHLVYLKTADTSGRCDWCKQHKHALHPHRDIEEGSCGPVYEVCVECIDAERSRWAEEDDDY